MTEKMFELEQKLYQADEVDAGDKLLSLLIEVQLESLKVLQEISEKTITDA